MLEKKLNLKEFKLIKIYIWKNAIGGDEWLSYLLGSDDLTSGISTLHIVIRVINIIKIALWWKYINSKLWLTRTWNLQT